MKKFFTVLTTTMLSLTTAYCQSSYSNLFYSNGATVFVQSGAVLHVQGDVVNASGSTLTNNGLLNVEGDITNNATINTNGAVGEGTTRLIGNGTVAGSTTTGVQTIKGTSTASFYNLVIDQGSTSQSVALGNNVSVGNAMVWGSSTTAGTYYVPASYSATIGNTTLMQVRGVTPGGHGIVKTYNGTSDYELYLSNAAPTALAGYQSISSFNFVSNTSALTGSANDAYISTRGVDGVTAGFARQVDRSGTYIFPIGSPNRTYNPVKVFFTGTPSAAMKLTSKFTEYALANTNTAFTNTFDQAHSTWPASTMNTSQYPIDYVANPGFNIFQQSSCGGPVNGNWLVMDKILKSHGYWSFDATPALSGTTYVIEAYPHGYDEWVTNGTNPNKRMLRTSATGFSGVPTVANFQSDLTTSVAPNYSDLITYTYFSNHKNFTTCGDGDGITGGRYSSFSHFAIGTSSSNVGNQALPVKLISLAATPVDNSYIRLDWVTASEINNKGFEILRSDNGTDWTNIGWVNGNGTTNEQHSYLFSDHTVQPNVEYYYRLNQTDYDGRTELTEIVSGEIISGSAITVAALQPNPANGSVRVTISTTEPAPATVTFYDILGKEIMSNSYELDYGTNTYQMNTEALAAATYSVVIKAGEKTFSKKLVIVR